MDEEKDLLDRIRSLAHVKGKEAPWITTIPDDMLSMVFSELKRGASNRSIARQLNQRLGLTASENSTAQAVGKLGKRIDSLLKTPEALAEPSVEFTVPSLSADMTPEERLEAIRQIEVDYSRLIQTELENARTRKMVPIDLHKHVTALSNLAKTRQRLEATMKSDGIPDRTSEILEKRAKKVFEFIEEDKDKWIRMATAFLEEAEKHCVMMQLNDNGEYELVE